MEAKGCAKPAVWKEARRYFYWAVRAGVARCDALNKLAEASPGASLEYRQHLIDGLAQIDETADNRTVAEALEALDIRSTVAQLKGDHLARQLLATSTENRKALMDGLVRIVDNLDDDERTALIAALQHSNRSPGTFRTHSSWLRWWF